MSLPILLDDLGIFLHILVAVMLSALVGYDREIKARPAGFRTHILVGAGATLFVQLGLMLAAESGLPDSSLRHDPIRILEAIISGVAFLGAGTIFFARKDSIVKGLTTAASLWITAGIGMAVALDHFLLATATSVTAFIVLHYFSDVEQQSSDKK